ncbi:PP2C family protein-serine/threonine phosphatase [Nesterenkonia sp. PF2B19]|uniref:PP2C family protein-serine/threonine phosphatase n=1 Tax=Nesterenkonia sp. PF2B19 TaxID=1881858 RepID=UPI000871D61C|nr:hypothetical protein [Nesterenkonia sp. PF2B19]
MDDEQQPRPDHGLYLDYGYGSHVGLRRELNEDSSVVTDSLFAVADGMGGHEAGEVASALAVQALAEAGTPLRGRSPGWSCRPAWTTPTSGSARPPTPRPAPR